MSLRHKLIALALLAGGCSAPPPTMPSSATPSPQASLPVLPPSPTPTVLPPETSTPTPTPEPYLPDVYKVQVDNKPSLSSFKALPDKPGLALTKDGLFHILPNTTHAWRWDAITKVYLDKIGDTPAIVIASGPTDQNDTFTILLKGAPDRDWQPNLEAGKELLPEIAKAAGLAPTEPNRWGRPANSHPVPPTPKFIPFSRPAPGSIAMKNAQLAALPQNLGVFLTSAGVAWAGPDRIDSITWANFKAVEVRDVPPIVYLSQHSGRFPTDFVAIAIAGPAKDASDGYVKPQDFKTLTELLKTRQAPAKSYAFELYSSRKDRGPADTSKPPASPLVTITTPTSEKVWPGSSLAGITPLKSGLYLLKGGLVRVEPNSIYQAAYAEIHQLGLSPDGELRLSVRKTNLWIRPGDIGESGDLLQVGKELLTITGLQKPEGEASQYNDSQHPKLNPPTTSRYLPDKTGEWHGPPLDVWGKDALAEGIHLYPEGVLIVEGAEIDGFRWDDLIDAKWEGDQLSVRVTGIDYLKLPVHGMHGSHPTAMYRAFLKALPAYFLAGTEKERPEGKARPLKERPTEVKHILGKDYPPDKK